MTATLTRPIRCTATPTYNDNGKTRRLYRDSSRKKRRTFAELVAYGWVFTDHAEAWMQARTDWVRVPADPAADRWNYELEDYFYIWSVRVSESERGKGYGRALMQEVIRRADGRTLVLDVELGNAPAIALYESVGFTITDSWSDGLEMTRE